MTAYLRTRPAADRPARLRERLLQAADELGARSPAADRALSRLYLGRGPHALVQAYRRGTVGVVNPFRAHVVDLKAVMAVMQSEEHRHLFTDAQHEAIARHVPWTRIVRPEAVLFEGQRVPLVGLLRENRTRFVLKPDAGCGGEGVVVGQGVDEPTWAAALALAQEPGQRYVAQEYVPMREDERPTVRKDASLFVGPQRVNVNTWAFDGAFGGAYARAAADFVVNVSKGGRFAPLVYVGGA